VPQIAMILQVELPIAEIRNACGMLISYLLRNIENANYNMKKVCGIPISSYLEWFPMLCRFLHILSTCMSIYCVCLTYHSH
jgi:hypothetical protein